MSQEQVDEKRAENNIEQIDERKREERALFPDVLLVCSQEDDRQHQVKGKAGAGQKNKHGSRPGMARSGNRPVQEERQKRIEREKIGGERNEEIGLGYRYLPAPLGCMKGLDRAAEKQSKKGVSKLVADDIGQDRLLEQEVDREVGKAAADEIVGEQRFVSDAEDTGSQLPGEARAEGEACDAERYFQDLLGRHVHRRLSSRNRASSSVSERRSRISFFSPMNPGSAR